VRCPTEQRLPAPVRGCTLPNDGLAAVAVGRLAPSTGCVLSQCGHCSVREVAERSVKPSATQGRSLTLRAANGSGDVERPLCACANWHYRPGADIGFEGFSDRRPTFALSSGGRLRPTPSGLSRCRAVAGTERSALYGLCVKPQPFIAAATNVTATLATELRCRGASRQDPRQSAIVVAVP
jgi:hypothetical protein